MHNSHSQDRPPPRDFRAEVTADIIKMLEEGAAPWQRPWDAGEFGRSPFNPTTDKPYRGGNVLALMIASMRKGYTDPRFCTFKQAQAKGWHVKKGEKATQIEFWEAKPGNKDEGADEDEKRSRLIHRVYSVFNAEQIDGIPALELPERKPFEIIEAAEKLLANSEADIRHGGAKAFYRPSGDYVQMPPRECFTDESHYYQTLFHELAHWTGAKGRLDRLKEDAPFGSPAYAHEEIVADLTSLYLAAELGIPYAPGEQASYIRSWIKVLKNDKNEVFKAASEASKASDYILGIGRGQLIEEPGPHAARVSEEIQARQGWAR